MVAILHVVVICLAPVKGQEVAPFPLFQLRIQSVTLLVMLAQTHIQVEREWVYILLSDNIDDPTSRIRAIERRRCSNDFNVIYIVHQ